MCPPSLTVFFFDLSKDYSVKKFVYSVIIYMGKEFGKEWIMHLYN